ncbi:hypothetical protein M569_01310, partial [Genlisea aurea]
EMENEVRKWEELLPDALGLIFKNLSLHEVLMVVPRVCKSWARAVNGPYCWQEIDIVEWSKTSNPEYVHRMLQLLIDRSCGSLQKLAVAGLSSDRSLMFIANHARWLKTLRLPRSDISDSMMEQVAARLPHITNLDLSYCINIGARGLEVVGKSCRSLTTLRRVMHPLDVIEKLSQDEEALAIARTMPRLKHLEIAYLLVETSSVLEILESCKGLELLDVRGCWSVNLDQESLKKCHPKLKVRGPLVVDCYDMMTGWDNCSDFSGSSGYLAWDFVAGDLESYEDDYD